MLETPSTPKPRERTGLWLYKIITGILIVVLLGVHFAVNHLLAPEGLLTYQEVVRYYTHPIVPIMEIIFLILVVSHALIGLRSILLDLNPSEQLLSILDKVFILVGAASIAYGIWLTLIIVQRGNAL